MSDPINPMPPVDLPFEVYQQWLLENQPQSPGDAPGAIGPGSLLTGGVSTSNISNTSVVNAGTQSILNNALFSISVFTTQFYLPYNPNRKSLAIQNQGGSTMYVSFTGAAPPFTTGFQIPAGFYWELYVAPINSVTVSGSNGVVIEGVLQ